MVERNVRLSSIILADDDSDDKEIFSVALSEINPEIDIQTVENGKELLKVLESASPDLLFLDINMFPIDGIEALKHIKENESLASLPVIMFSSSGRPNDIHQSYQLGANLFITKKETYSELKKTLEKALALDWTHPEQIRGQFYNTCFTTT